MHTLPCPIWLATDGHMSGASGKVPAAIHVTPERRRADRPLSRMHDGNVIRLDGKHGVEVRVPAAELAKRPLEPVNLSSYQYVLGRELFAAFRANAAGVERGALAFAALETAEDTPACRVHRSTIASVFTQEDVP